MERNVFSVSQINDYLKAKLEEDDFLSAVAVSGEISNYKLYPSGHHYFTLKDADGALKCVLFKGNAMRLRFRPENGMQVIAMGHIAVYPRDGAYQLYCSALLPDGVRYRAVYGNQSAQVCLPIPGRFSVYNSLTVLGLALELGVDLEAAAAALKTARGVKGRVEVVPTPGKDFTVLIDYAHTPDGLENVLSTVRGFCKGRLIAVFGCGGDRDPMKRPIMARIGARLADFAILTSDNPRSEDPEAILTDMCRGLTGENWEVVPDRRAAIRRAMDMAKQGDIVVLAGKGHETYQEIRGVKRHLDEREEVAAHLKEME